MKNDLYRKLTSITLMTIMFAGGMTIAIPGELPGSRPDRHAQRLGLSRPRGGSFGGPQIIEIIVDDPSKSDLNAELSHGPTLP